MTTYLCKWAEKKEEAQSSPMVRALKTLGTTLAGAGVGAGLGYGTMHALDQLHRQRVGTPLNTNPKIVVPLTAVLGLASGYAFNKLRDAEVKELRDAWWDHRKRQQGKPTGQ